METKKRKGSTTTTIKSFNASIKKLEELKMATKEELTQLNVLKKAIYERWQAIEMNL